MANEIMGADLALSLGEAMILVMQGMAGKAPRVNATNNHWEVWDNDDQQWVDTGVKATGEDGHSPYIGENGHWFVWDENLAVFVDTGVAAQGPRGETGADGADGADGYSPAVTITNITGGHTVTITDEDHPQGQSFNVMNGLDSISEDVKVALLNCFENVAWINDDGQTYYDALYDALYPPVDVLSISAVFTQGSAVIYDTDSLDTLKQYLVVTATMTDSTTETVTNYTLSGILTVGTSTITVSYGGKTTTFSVTVTENTAQIPAEYQEVEWVGRTATTSSTGPYIDTGFSATEKAGMTGYDITFDALASDPSISIVGASNPIISWSSNSACYFGSFYVSGGVVRMGVGTDSTQYFDASVIPSDRHSFRVYWDSTSIHVESEGLSCTRDFVAGSADLHLRIGTGTWASNASGGFKVFGDVTIQKDGTVVSNLVPCYRKSDSVIGFYDTIRETFYTNAGSGAFEKGADV